MTARFIALIEQPGNDELEILPHIFEFAEDRSLRDAWREIDFHLDAAFVICIWRLPSHDILIKFGDDDDAEWNTRDLETTQLPITSPVDGHAEGANP